MAGAKGFALTLGLEILTGVLAGGKFAPNVGSQHKAGGSHAGIGQFFAAIGPGAIMDADEFSERTQQRASNMRAAPRRHGADAVRLPGERRPAVARRRAQTGMPISPAIFSKW